MNMNQTFDVVDGSLVGSACFYYSNQEKNCTGEEVGQTRKKTKQCLQMSSEKFWRTPVLYVAANIRGNGVPVRNTILNFFAKFRKSVEH